MVKNLPASAGDIRDAGHSPQGCKESDTTETTSHTHTHTMTAEAEERAPWPTVHWLLMLLSGGSLPRIHWYLTARTECHGHTRGCNCGGKKESIIFKRLGDFHRDSSTSRSPKRNLVKEREAWFIPLASRCLHAAASFSSFSATPSPTRNFT